MSPTNLEPEKQEWAGLREGENPSLSGPSNNLCLCNCTYLYFNKSGLLNLSLFSFLKFESVRADRPYVHTSIQRISILSVRYSYV